MAYYIRSFTVTWFGIGTRRLTDIVRIWPFWFCLALNYVALGIKPLNLVGNCDPAMRLAYESFVTSASSISKLTTAFLQANAFVSLSFPNSRLIYLQKIVSWEMIPFCNIFKSPKTRVFELLFGENCMIIGRWNYSQRDGWTDRQDDSNYCA